jgi:hypothetical protein
VINLFGGSGLGKSTTASLLFGEMKLEGYHVELVSEYVKTWAWQGRRPTGFDQFYIAGKQAHSESQLYGKVDYIITDSPLLLSGFYEQFHLGRQLCLPTILNFLDYAKEHNIEHLNFLLQRNKKFDPRGRFETEEEAINVDVKLKSWLQDLGLQYTLITESDHARVSAILNFVKDHSGAR